MPVSDVLGCRPVLSHHHYDIVILTDCVAIACNLGVTLGHMLPQKYTAHGYE